MANDEFTRAPPQHVQEMIQRLVMATGQANADDAIGAALSHLAINITTVTTVKKMTRGEAKAYAGRIGKKLTALVEANYDYARKNIPQGGVN